MSTAAEPGAARVSADPGSMLSTLRTLWPSIWPSERPDLKLRVFIAFVAMGLGQAATLLVPYTFKWATDALTPGRGEPLPAASLLALPILLVVAYGLVRIGSTALTQVRDALFAKVGQHAVRQLAYRTFVHLHGLSLRFHLERRTGGLSRVIERGTKGIETIVRFTILNTLPTILQFLLVGCVLLFHFDVWYVLVVAVTTWAYVWYTIRTSNWRIAIRRDMNQSDTDANSKAIDSLLNYETVKYFGNERMEAERFDRSMARYEAAAVRTWTSLAWLNTGQTIIFSIGMVIVMGLSAHAILAGRQSIGDFVLVNGLLMQLAVPLNFIGFVYREIRQALADIEAMFDLLAVDPEVKDAPDAPPIRIEAGEIVFEDVHFHYDPARPILKGISFHVPAGRTVAIVGPSGAGKSTISRLLFRFYDVTGGRILIDGQDVRSVSQASLRAAIGIVPQDTVLFNDTIGYNIRYGRPEATEEEVAEAAQMAQIAGFIERLPAGYDTEVGERGLKLSGGEKQRVAIARTILKGPPILVLDEATSALDSHTEREIQVALDRVSRNRTTLVIAHRLSTVVNADEIIVIDDGRIVERGTHQALLAADGLYASMWNRQRAADEARERLRQSEAGEGARFVIRDTRTSDLVAGG